MRFPQFVPMYFLILAVQEPLAFLSALFLHQLLDPCCLKGKALGRSLFAADLPEGTGGPCV